MLPTISDFGESALIVEAPGDLTLEAQQRIWALAARLKKLPGISETGLGMASLLVSYDNDRIQSNALTELIVDHWQTSPPLDLQGRIWEFPVVYGGERGADLKDVAVHAGVAEAEAAAMHAAVEYVIFAPSVTPGFGYLFGVPHALVMPRKQKPIMLKKPGTVSIGGVQATIGMTPGPSGWYALGFIPEFHNPFDPRRDPPLQVAVGDKIRFVVADVL